MLEACAALEAPFVQSLACVTGHEAVSSRYFLLRLRCGEIARRARPGQFVMLACAPDSPAGGTPALPGGHSEPLLPRPLAILDARGEEFELLYFVAGYGTEILRRTAGNLNAGGDATQAHAGSALRILGPLGRGFEPLPDVDAHIALGGGSGVAPLVFFLRRYANATVGPASVPAGRDAGPTTGRDAGPATGRNAGPATGRNAEAAWHLILAARTRDQLAREDTVATPGTRHHATDDGSAGIKGTAVDALRSLLDGELKGRRCGIYAAGPEAMMLAAAKLARERQLPARVSLEARMACGVGVCRACVVDGISPHKKTGLFRRTVCQDGPVFDIGELAGW